MGDRDAAWPRAPRGRGDPVDAADARRQAARGLQALRGINRGLIAPAAPRDRASTARSSSARTAPRRWPPRRRRGAPAATSSRAGPSPSCRREGRWLEAQGCSPSRALRRGAPRAGHGRTPSRTPRARWPDQVFTPRDAQQRGGLLAAAQRRGATISTAEPLPTERRGLGEAIGVGKGTVSLEDIERAGAIFVIGQNPGTNHPRMLTTLAAAKRRAARIVAINPLRERLARAPGILALPGGRRDRDLYLQVRGGRGAAQGHHEGTAGGRGARAGTRARLAVHPAAHRGIRGAAHRSRGAALRGAGGAQRHPAPRHARSGGDLRRRGRRRRMLGDGDHATPARVANAGDPNLLPLRQHRPPGAGPCRSGGHSNAGDRTVGITSARQALRGWERSSTSPARRTGLDVVGAIRGFATRRARLLALVGTRGGDARHRATAASSAGSRCRSRPR
jgi:hypothetical protein